MSMHIDSHYFLKKFNQNYIKKTIIKTFSFLYYVATSFELFTILHRRQFIPSIVKNLYLFFYSISIAPAKRRCGEHLPL